MEVQGVFGDLERLSRRDIDFLTEAISPRPQKKNQPRLDHTSLWWNNLSNLQKSIRRGDVEQATESACRLYCEDAVKFLRRLSVVALEDVGFGDLSLVATVLGYASQYLGQQRDLLDSSDLGKSLTLVEWLASAVKDRSSCELATASNDPPERRSQLQRVGDLSPHDTALIYADRNADLRDRCLAGWSLSGNLLLNGKRIGTRDHAMLGAALHRMCLPEIVQFIVAKALRFGGEAGALAVNLAALYGLMRAEDIESRTNVLPQADTVQGLLSPSFDVHTRTGLRALATFAINCKDIRQVCALPGANPRRIVGTVAFRAEGSAVDQELVSPLGDVLHELNERATCAAIGFPYEVLPEAKRVFLNSLDSLNEFRRYYAAQESKSLGLA